MEIFLPKSEIGIIGLSTMGRNMAMNIAEKGFLVSAYNRTASKTNDLIKQWGSSKGILAFYKILDFVNSLRKPRKIILLIKPGKATDNVINELLPYLDKKDIIIDSGNSYFEDTIRREADLKKKGIFFTGMGISGGEQGARFGPSMMFGGNKKAWRELRPILEKIVANDFSCRPCIAYMGENGGGHFVKMVHNGVEYAVMQLLAETYWLLKQGLGLNNEKMANIFSQWNKGKLESFLIQITARILNTRDKDGRYVLDQIMDIAGSKGTGKWTSLEALEIGIPCPTLTSAVYERYFSTFKKLRQKFAGRYNLPIKKTNLSLNTIKEALYFAVVVAYTQGFELIREAMPLYRWRINLVRLSQIWQGGCIIRSKILLDFEKIFSQETILPHALLSNNFKPIVEKNLESLRNLSVAAIKASLPVPTFLSTVSYFDSLKSKDLPANLIQAQRDFFGAHTFQKEVNGRPIHFHWPQVF